MQWSDLLGFDPRARARIGIVVADLPPEDNPNDPWKALRLLPGGKADQSDTQGYGPAQSPIARVRIRNPQLPFGLDGGNRSSRAHLPFAMLIRIGSVGWQAAAHPALSDMASVQAIIPARGQIEGLSVRRRDFVISLACAIWGRPITLRAQQKAMPLIGFLSTASPGTITANVAAFREGLSQDGYVEGRNFAIEYRWAEGHYDRLPVLAANLVGRKVDVIVANGPGILAAKNATMTIPIIFFGGGALIDSGAIGNLAQPSGNVTGFSVMFSRVGTEAARFAVRAGSSGQGHCSACEPD